MLNKFKNLETAQGDYGKNLLIAAAVLTVMLWQFPFGNYLLYPFYLLGTWIHEMGHGLAALLVGGSFIKLEVFADGSGLAYYGYSEGSLLLGTRLSIALIAAAGLVFPPMVGGAMILASRSLRGAMFGLVFLLGLMALSLLVWVRNGFGFVAIGAMTGVLALLIYVVPPAHLRFLAKFIGVQAALGTFLNWRYLFTKYANVGGASLSDTGVMEAQLWLPYWFWGGAIALFSAGLLFFSLHLAYRKAQTEAA